MVLQASALGRPRAAAAVAVALLLLAVLVVALHLDSARDHRRWVAACQARGGHVVTEVREQRNPLLVGTTDPVYRCTASLG